MTAIRPKKPEEHIFSIELKSKENLKRLSLPDDEEGNILIEGFLGKLQSLSLTEGIMLEINGTNGSFKMDFNEKELQKLLQRKKPNSKKNPKETIT